MAEPPDAVKLAALRADLISRFADDAAHEIRNPLNALVINLAVLRSRVAANERDAALGRIDVLDSEVRRIHGILERLVALLRPPRDTDENTELAAALDDVVPLITLHAGARRIAATVCAIPDGLHIAMPRAGLRYAILDAAMAILDRVSDNGSLEIRVEAAPPAIVLLGSPGDAAAGPAAALLAQVLLEAAAGSIGPDPKAFADAVSLRLVLPARA